MNLKELTETVNNIYYADSTSLRVIESKCYELLSIMGEHRDIKNIDTKCIMHYIKELETRENKPATINAKLAYLSKCLKYAYHNGLIPYKPEIPHKKIVSIKEKYISDVELQKMIDYTIKNNMIELYQVIVIGVNTGIRISNILSIIPEDDIENNYIRIYHNKTNKPYSVPLNDTLKELFKNFVPFTMNYQQIRYQWHNMINDLNLDKRITIHTLRHTTASKLIQKDVPIPIIQKILNHTSIKTTMRYAHLNNKQLEEAVQLL